ERQAGIKCLNFAAERHEHSARVALDARHERHVRAVVAQERPVEGGLRGFAEAVVLAIGRHADDLPEWIFGAAEVEAPADGVLIGKEFARERLVDYDDARFLLVLLRREVAPTQSDLHRLKVFWADSIQARCRQV